jgi:predicted nuclease of restriction endonuclease-like RecB superfamily
VPTKRVKKTKTPKVRNKFERKILDQLEDSGLEVSYESTRIPYVLAGYYLPDYVVSTPNGKIFIEAKGHFRPEAKRKMCAVKRQHPELDIRIVFYRYSVKYERWAKKNGFICAWGEVPDEWLEGGW